MYILYREVKTIQDCSKDNTTMNENKVLAGLAVFRSLYDSEKDIYEVIAAFLKEIIFDNKLYSFTSEEITNKLNSIYQFDIPVAVVSSSLKRISFITKSNGHYVITENNILSSVIGEKEENVINAHKEILSQLYKYIEKELNITINEDNQTKIQSDFCNFLLDKEMNNEFIPYISGFIISRQNDTEFQKKLTLIREGVILHTGIRYNSDPADRGGWKSPLVIFFDLEILFHLAGYNGEIHKIQAEELISYIKELNRKEKKIELKYFKDTKSEIDKFFRIAERIVKGIERINPRITAMVSITNGCTTSSEIQCKKDDFFSLIENKHQILEDNYDKYYLEENFKYNIIEKQDIDIPEVEEADYNYNSLIFLNYIAIRRKDKISPNFENIGYILLTGNKTTQNIASEKCTKGNVPLSTNIGFMINKIWFKLNKGLSKSFPQSFNIISKSQIILSKLICDGVGEKYNQLKEEIDKNKITKEQAKSRYNHLRSNIKRPEDVDINVIEDIYSFLEDNTESYLAQQEYLRNKTEELEQNYDNLLKEREEDFKLKRVLLDSMDFKLKTLKEKKESVIKSKKEIEDDIMKKEKLSKRTSKICFWSISILIYIIISILLFIYTYYNKEIFDHLGITDIDKGLGFGLNIISFLSISFPLIFILIKGHTFSPQKAIIRIRENIFNSIHSKTLVDMDEQIKKIQNFDIQTSSIEKELATILLDIKNLRESIAEKEKYDSQ